MVGESKLYNNKSWLKPVGLSQANLIHVRYLTKIDAQLQVGGHNQRRQLVQRKRQKL